jgi:hypothetical protein
MKKEKVTYKCETCGDTVVREEGGAAPECCNSAMKAMPLDPCTNAAHPEMARNDEIEDACDDGRGIS